MADSQQSFKQRTHLRSGMRLDQQINGQLVIERDGQISFGHITYAVVSEDKPTEELVVEVAWQAEQVAENTWRKIDEYRVYEIPWQNVDLQHYRFTIRANDGTIYHLRPLNDPMVMITADADSIITGTVRD